LDPTIEIMSAPALPVPAPAGFNPWPYALMAFFGVLITAIASMITFALRQDDQLVSGDYYEQELHHQQQIERVRRTQAFAGQVSVEYAGGEITVVLPAAHARQQPTGSVQLYRPSDARLDRDVKLAVNAAGRQQIDARGLRPGLWRVRVTWTAGTEEYFRDATVIVPAA
jgi:nitrogen fixation protein FixH